MRVWWTLLLVPALLTAAAAVEASDAAVRKALQANYNRFCKAFMTRDTSIIEKMTAPGFKSTSTNGRVMNRQQAMQMLKQQLQMMPPGSKMTCKITGLKVKGKRAVVQTAATVEAKVPGQNNQMQTLVAKATSEDVWTKSGADWKILQVTDKSSEMTLNGQKFDPAALMGGGAQR